MKPPAFLWTMTTRILLQVRPAVHASLQQWIDRARHIPDPELRRQALLSIDTKTFHCEGGSIYSLLAGKRYPEAVRFIVAYQTISDYLDNLCDRSTSKDPEDFRALHEAMRDALSPGTKNGRYYRLHPEKDDRGYLPALVETCREVLASLPAYDNIAPHLHALADCYGALQVHKHAAPGERVPRLQGWHRQLAPHLPPMAWYEFAACTGSTLGIFCLVSLALGGPLSPQRAEGIRGALFPWVQGLHILLDYFIDQEEDRRAGDLNFCTYYDSNEAMVSRLTYFYRQAECSVAALPDARFHHMVNRGLLGMYLADRKVTKQARLKAMARRILHLGGTTAFFFFIHLWVYRRLKASRAKIPWNLIQIRQS